MQKIHEREQKLAYMEQEAYTSQQEYNQKAKKIQHAFDTGSDQFGNHCECPSTKQFEQKLMDKDVRIQQLIDEK